MTRPAGRAKEGAGMTEAKRAISYELDVQEMSFVDLTYQWLSEVKEPQKLHDLLAHFAQVKGIPLEKVMERIAILYSDLNFDGRFTCVGENMWGLKHWYPIESTEDDVLSVELAEEDEEYHEDYDEDHEDDRLLDDEDTVAPLDDYDEPDLGLDDEDPIPLDDELDEEDGY